MVLKYALCRKTGTRRVQEAFQVEPTRDANPGSCAAAQFAPLPRHLAEGQRWPLA